MRPIDHLDMAAEELAERIKGPVWDRWVSAEPQLGRLCTLEELRDLRGAEADQLLAAPVRLAAKDGGDDELAAAQWEIAVVGRLAALAPAILDCWHPARLPWTTSGSMVMRSSKDIDPGYRRCTAQYLEHSAFGASPSDATPFMRGAGLAGGVAGANVTAWTLIGRLLAQKSAEAG